MAIFGDLRNPVTGAFEASVAFAASSAGRDEDFVPFFFEIGQNFAVLSSETTVPTGTSTVTSARHGHTCSAAAILAIHGDDDPAMTEIIKGIEIGFGHEINRAAVAPIAAIGSAPFGVFIAQERDGAIATLAASHFNDATINQHKSLLPSFSKRRFLFLRALRI
jgi:hypothetical protein